MSKNMNQRQTFALKNPCYTPDDYARPIFEQTETLGKITLRTHLKVLAFFQNELWRATAFAEDADGNQLKESDLSEQEKGEINKNLYGLLENVGRGEIRDMKDESDFDCARFLTPFEIKKLTPPNLNKLLNIKERQKFALENPFPTMEDMLAKKYSLEIDFGGGLINTVLTVEKKGGRLVWQASVSAPTAKERPQRFFKEVPGAQTEMSLKIMKLMLTGVGSGEMVISPVDKDTVVLTLWRDVAVQEKKLLPQTTLEFGRKESPFFAKRHFN